MRRILQHTKCAAVGAVIFFSVACGQQVSFQPTPEPKSKKEDVLVTAPLEEIFDFSKNGLKPQVDVLFIDDNSASMKSKQTKLGNALGSFINSLGPLDWQIGVTTTDTSDGQNGLKGSLLNFEGLKHHILTPDVMNYTEIFKNTIQREEQGSGDERPMRALMQAFAKHSANNAGFFREDVDLAVVLLTDEDEASNGNTTANKPEDVIDAFEATFGVDKNITVYGIMVDPKDTPCYEAEKNDGTKYANVLSQLVEMTGGVTGSICDADYGPTLASIGDRVREGIRTIVLRKQPLYSTFDLKIEPPNQGLTWKLRGRVIVFNKPPSKDTIITAIYKTPEG